MAAAERLCPPILNTRRPSGGLKEPTVEKEYLRLDQSQTCLGSAFLDHAGFIRPEKEPQKLYRTVGMWFEHDKLPPRPEQRYHKVTERSATWPYGQNITRVYPGADEDCYTLGPIVLTHSFPHVPPAGPPGGKFPDYGLYAPKKEQPPPPPGLALPFQQQAAGMRREVSLPALAPPSGLTANDQPYMKMASYSFPRNRGMRRRPEWLLEGKGGDPDDVKDAAKDMAKHSMSTIFCAKRGSGSAAAHVAGAIVSHT